MAKGTRTMLLSLAIIGALLSEAQGTYNSWFRPTGKTAEIVTGMTDTYGVLCGFSHNTKVASFKIELLKDSAVIAVEDYQQPLLPVHSYPSDMAVQTTRNVTDKFAEMKYQWDNPGKQHEGIYKCRMRAVATDGGVLNTAIDLNVFTRDPNGRELHDLILMQQAQIDALRDGVKVLAEEVIGAKKLAVEVGTKVAEEMKNRTRGHVEKGTVDCGNAAKWTNKIKSNPGARFTAHLVKFEKAYTEPPVVFARVKYLYANTDRPIRYYSTVGSVNATHAQLACFQYEAMAYPSSRIQAMYLEWLSLPKEL